MAATMKRVRLLVNDLMDVDGETIPKGSRGFATALSTNDHYKLLFNKGQVTYLYVTDFQQICEVL